MDFENFRDIIVTYLKAQAVKAATVENVRLVFKKVLEPLEDAAARTETGLDDWVIDALFAIVEDDKKMQKVVDFIHSKLADGICETCPEDYEALAHELTMSTEPHELDADRFWAVLRIVKAFVEVVVPVIDDFLKDKDNLN